jgi:hypothetical protein
MSGKALLILVIGFTLIFIVAGYFWGSLATRSVDNHVSYYKNTIAHNIAVSGANIALAEISQDSTWMESSTFSKDFENGEMNVDIPALGPMVRAIKSTGTFMGVDQIVKVKWMRDLASLAKYAWFIPSVSTGSPQQRPWITGDSIWGGFQSNQFTVVDGDPVFFGKVSDLKGIKDMGSGSDPQFLGGYQTGVDVAWVSSMHYPDYAALAGPSATYTKDLWLEFNSDGTVTYRVGASNNAGQDSTKYGAPNTVAVSAFAPNGVVYVDKANVYMSGVLNGKVTIVAEGASGSGGPGNVYLTGDMIYNIDPMIPNGAGGYMVNPASLDADEKPIDVMGIIATNDIVVSTSNKGTLGGYENNVVSQDIHIDAGIFCNSGGFRAESLGSTQDGTDVPMGSIYLQGSMTAGKEEIVAQFDGSTLTAGYNRHVIFDERFATGPPTFFPYITYYRVISWLE